MKAMVLTRLGGLRDNETPLELQDVPAPSPAAGEVLLAVSTCAVCHTELDEIEGRTPPALPVVPGHQVIGTIAARGAGARRFAAGQRVGVGWIFHACGRCPACREGRENLCASYRATGRDAHGGYAEYMVVPEAFAHAVPEVFSDVEAAPLLCAGAIGYRSLRLAGLLRDGQRLGLMGFGASAHLVLQLVRHRFPRVEVFVFARSEREREFARSLGAAWAGATEEQAPARLEAIIDTTPAWKPVVEALANLAPGGRLVINAIRKEDTDKDVLLSLDYPRHLWMEKEIVSVANVTRLDIEEFLQLAAEIPLRPAVEEFPLEEANRALIELKRGKIRGAKVLRIGHTKTRRPVAKVPGGTGSPSR
jgi:alcohol dehydrogenase, propanol-preferring